MNQKLFILLILSFSSVALKAQLNLYEKAFYITLDDDTIHGFIKPDNDYDLTRQAYFKSSTELKQEITLTPSNTKKFVFQNGKTFERLEIVSNKDNVKISNFIFGKTLVKGICSLYNISQSYNYEDIEFAIEKNCRVTRLYKQNYYFEYEPGNIDYTKIVCDYRYLGILKAYLNDCDSIKTILDNSIMFNQNSLVYIVNKYNRLQKLSDIGSVCKPIETFNPPIKSDYSKKTLYYTQSLIKNNSRFKTNFSFALGFSVDYFNPDKIRFLSFTYGLQYYYLNYDINIKYKFRSYSVHVKKDFIIIPISLNIQLIKKHNFIFYGFGGANLSYSNLINVSNDEFYDDENAPRLMTKFEPRSRIFEISGMTGFGSIYKHLYCQIYFDSPLFYNFSLGYCF